MDVLVITPLSSLLSFFIPQKHRLCLRDDGSSIYKGMTGAVYIHGRSEIRNFSSSVKNIAQHEKRNFVSPSGNVMFCSIY